MINWLIQQSLMISVIILILAFCKVLGFQYLGARGVYRLWILIPLSMATGALPGWQYTQGSIVNYLVSVKQTSDQVSEGLMLISDLILALWVMVILVSLLILSHYQHKQKLRYDSVDANCLLFSTKNQQSIWLNNLTVKSSHLAVSPYITGILKPTLVLPLDFFKCFDEQQQSLILNHELHHFRSGDLLSINLASAGVNHSETSDAYPIMRVEPKYPTQAAQNNIEGSVTLTFDIDSGGSVKNVSIVNSKPEGIFDRSAKKALQQWKYASHGKQLLSQLVQLDFVLQEAIDKQGHENYDGSHERNTVTK